MKKPVVFMYSGQGSQYYHMGKELYEHHPRFKYWMDYCNDLVSPMIHTSLIDILYYKTKKSEPFDRILYSNPALLCIEYSLTKVLLEMDIRPTYLLGYSLGEITSAVVSNSISLQEGIQLTVDFAKILESESPAGGMLSIMESEQIVKNQAILFEQCWVSSINIQQNFVVSSKIDNIKRLQQALRCSDITTQLLPVKYAFHSALMDPLEKKFKDRVGRVRISPMRLPICSASRVGMVDSIDDVFLWDVIRRPVEFRKTISFMLSKRDYIFIDVGPSGTLSTFVKYLLPATSQSNHFAVVNQFGRDLCSLEKLRKDFSLA